MASSAASYGPVRATYIQANSRSCGRSGSGALVGYRNTETREPTGARAPHDRTTLQPILPLQRNDPEHGTVPLARTLGTVLHFNFGAVSYCRPWFPNTRPPT